MPGSPPRLSLAQVVAVVGCDGSGKSTLAAELVARLRAQGPVELVYLGQSSGKIADWIRGLPVVGTALARHLVGKAARVHDQRARATGGATALTIYLLSRWRAHKFRRMLALGRRGVWVITDRYPQAETPGFRFDGPGLDAANTRGWLAGKLAANERRLYLWMASHVPALVIRLNVDAGTAHARKPDHALSTLQQKVAVIPTLQFNGAPILDLDGCQPYPRVLDAALHGMHAAVGTASN